MTISSGIIIGILSLMLIVTGWMINKIWSDSKDNNNRMHEQIASLNNHILRLSDSITGLNGIILAQNEKFTGNEKACELRHKVVDEKLDNHERRITYHGKEIDQVKIKIHE